MTRHVVIIGGGASGTLAAAHLLRQCKAPSPLRVTLIEARHDLGRGIAYSTPHGCHLLNTRVQNMSAFPDEPDHFARWLLRHGHDTEHEAGFVPRRIYGLYLSELVAPSGDLPASPRLEILHQECVDLRLHDHGVDVVLADGSALACHQVILATGYCQSDAVSTALENPWQMLPVDQPDRPVVLIGSGLTMVDMVLSLRAQGQRGPIYALSRRGLLPQPHRMTQPLRLAAADIPFGTSLATLLRWLRATIRAHLSQGGDWRDVIDGLRPHTQALWHHMPADSRARFLRHASSIWDTHRHRMPPVSERQITEARSSGQLQLIRGAFHRAVATPDAVHVQYRPHGAASSQNIEAGRAIDCRGFRRLIHPPRQDW